MRCAIVIAGPTASGKSTLGLQLAERLSGTIINADSMQVYRDLDILTARPGVAELRRVPHRLFGVRDAAFPASVGWWHVEATREIRQVWLEERVPILIGGTGLYLKSLFEGLSAIPAIPESVRRSVRARMAEEGPRALHAELVRRDPYWAERTPPGDRQRITRALEVLEASGRRLSEFFAERTPGALERTCAEGRVLRLVLAPPRAKLYQRIERRFTQMIEHGALNEVRRLLERGLDPELPAMKAIGVPPLIAHLKGEIDLEAACALAKRDTRRYAKRQMTWARHQFADWDWPEWPSEEADTDVLDQLADGIVARFERMVRPFADG
ncbi:MAG: tRNA (adenosine(37)-N6)-dimethylallyltransferase MiaA [Alphaproteobacteria bacterium]|nr:MAG: tRNA (adenosine(37)-N6)-dimethylallyltransferase MiaA [Alphaproteobacteria bacterium]